MSNLSQSICYDTVYGVDYSGMYIPMTNIISTTVCLSCVFRSATYYHGTPEPESGGERHSELLL